jgi:serine/threonine-protein kinase RsbW
MRASITLPSDHAALVKLQTFGGEFAHQCDLPRDERARLLIILEELFTNAVTHGYGDHSETGNITVALQLGVCRIEIDFIDDGRPFDPLSRDPPDLDAPENERAVGGLGIHLVRSLVDEAHYRREGGRNRLRLVRRIKSLSGAGD